MTLELRLSVAQVAEAWGCSLKHVYNLVNRGELPAIRIGDLYRFRREDIEAYERRGETQQPEPDPEPVPVPTLTPVGVFDSPGYRAGWPYGTNCGRGGARTGIVGKIVGILQNGAKTRSIPPLRADTPSASSLLQRPSERADVVRAF